MTPPPAKLLSYARRSAALSILLLLVLGGAWTVWALEAARQESLEAIAFKREILGKLMAMSRRSQELDAALARAQDNPGRAWFMAGESDALIVAQLQQRLQDVMSMHGAQLLRASEVEPMSRDGQDYRGLRIELGGAFDIVQRVLFEIEAGVPYLFITRAQIAADPGGLDGVQAPLHVNLEIDVYGAILPTAARGKAGS